MARTLPDIILNNLINSEPYARKALPHLKNEYFEGPYVPAFELIVDFVANYNKLPTREILEHEFSKSKSVNADNANEVYQIIVGFDDDLATDSTWLEDETEKWCKDRAIMLGVMSAIEIIDGKGGDLTEGMIPDILQEALSVTFDTSVGHDYFADAESRIAFYKKVETKIPFDLEMMNQITNGGVTRKTLNVVMASCVHPDTPIQAKYSKKGDTEHIVATIKISAVADLLNDYDVEVWSPDGFVEVSDYVTKGLFDEFILTVGSRTVRCNANHKFETTIGWLSAHQIMTIQAMSLQDVHYLTSENTHELGHIEFTGKQIEIVDIQVEHDNHRYYTNGISSHNTGAGKSLFMCHLAWAALADNQNVLYITMEMSEHKIAERIDANLLDHNIQELQGLANDRFIAEVKNVKRKSTGNLIIKEYPTASAHAGHFRALLSELRLKKDFIPDVIFIDYLNICMSSRLSSDTAGSNSYGYIKSIAEELRGLAVEHDVPIWSATQTNRSGFDNTDVDLTNTSESIGLSSTVDLQIALISTDELKEMNQIMIKQLKNRYNDLEPSRFVLGIDRPKMRLYDIAAATNGIIQGTTVGVTPQVTQTPFAADTPKSFKGFKV